MQVAGQPSASGRITTQVPNSVDTGGIQGLHLPGVCQLLGTHWSTQRCQNLTPVKTRSAAISGSRGTQGLSLPTFPPAFPLVSRVHPRQESGIFFTDEKTEAQRGQWTFPGDQVIRGRAAGTLPPSGPGCAICGAKEQFYPASNPT